MSARSRRISPRPSPSSASGQASSSRSTAIRRWPMSIPACGKRLCSTCCPTRSNTLCGARSRSRCAPSPRTAVLPCATPALGSPPRISTGFSNASTESKTRAAAAWREAESGCRWSAVSSSCSVERSRSTVNRTAAPPSPSACLGPTELAKAHRSNTRPTGSSTRPIPTSPMWSSGWPRHRKRWRVRPVGRLRCRRATAAS